MDTKKTILICPLDWGLGHASRCVPIIKELSRLGFDVIIGADKNPLAFLQQEFPNLPTITIPGYEVTYDEKGSFYKLLIEGVKFYQFIKKEHQLLEKIINENNIDVVISDNRYGLWSDKVKSILITHQLFIKAPLGETLVHKKIHGLIEKFDDCWIPDIEGKPNLSGDLAHLTTFKHPHRFIGALSRFLSLNPKQPNVIKEDVDVCAILSGPEPQRTIFEKLITKQLVNSRLNAVLVRGLPDSKEELNIENARLKVINHLKTKELHGLIQKSKVIVCRAGYSSIMDLFALSKKAILVPTPGQTEQEYLAKHHQEQGNFCIQTQSAFDLQKGMLQVENCSPLFKLEKKLTLPFLLKNE